MAEQTIAPPLEVSDSELFQGALADEPVTEQSAPEPQAEPEQPRDEHGRFAPKPKVEEAQAPPAEVAQQAPTEPPQPDDAQVPSWRLREIREARDAAVQKAEEAARERYALQQQLQQMQNELAAVRKPKPEPVDFFQNPDEAIAQRLSPLDERFQQLEQSLKLRTSRVQAIAVHGAKQVQEMEAAVAKAMQSNHPEMPLLAAQMRASDDPAEVGMQWHTRNKLLQETGGDLTAYRQKILDEAMKSPEFQAKVIEAARGQAAQPNGRPPPISLPPSLNKTPGSGASQPPDADNDMSDAALFKYAAAPARKRA
jgi:hypothetical protein